MLTGPNRWQSHSFSAPSTIYDDGLEPVQVHHGIEAIPVAPGLEPTPAELYSRTYGPQVVLGEEEKETLAHRDDGPSRTHQPICGMPRKRFWTFLVAIIVLIAIAVALAVAIPATRARKSASRATAATPNVTDATPNSTISKPISNLSTSGAFNGTGMALLDLGVDRAVDAFVWFQDYKGQIRSSELKGLAWRQGQSSDIVVASNVKNCTPLTAVSYTKDTALTVHLFYIDSSNVIQEMIHSNTSNRWIKGSLGSFNFKVSESASVDLAACYNDQWYGSAAGSSGGIRLFYGASNTTVQELSWAVGSTAWTSDFLFPRVNGKGGLSCAGAGSGTSYLYLLDSHNQLELWWKDFNTAAVNSTNHPLGVWTQGPTAATSVRTNSPLSYDNFVYFQDPSNNIIGIQPDPSAESSSFKASFQVGGGATGVPNTRIASTTFYPTADTPSELHVFFQTNGSDITEYLRGQNGGQWSSNTVPVE
ncbi:MAG: hypothetical protein M1830_006739 [Pleopsidium flavum]|nr:MAG: hypothetical protein M1830_006739 [Pleopsidium flavum]